MLILEVVVMQAVMIALFSIRYFVDAILITVVSVIVIFLLLPLEGDLVPLEEVTAYRRVETFQLAVTVVSLYAFTVLTIYFVVSERVKLFNELKDEREEKALYKKFINVLPGKVILVQNESKHVHYMSNALKETFSDMVVWC